MWSDPSADSNAAGGVHGACGGVRGVHVDVHGGVHDSNAGGARPAVPLSGAQLAPIVGGHNPLEANTTSDDLKFSISPTFNSQ